MEDLISCSLPETSLIPDVPTIINSAKVSPRGTLYPISLRFESSTAHQLLVLDVRVGSNSQLCGTDDAINSGPVGLTTSAVPGSLFNDSNIATPFCMDSLTPGMSMSITVVNTSDYPIKFRGSVLARRTKPDNALPYLLPFGTTLPESPGSLVTTTTRTQVKIRPTRLYVPREVLEHFQVESLTSEPYLDELETTQASREQLSIENLESDGLVSLLPHSTLSISTKILLTARSTSHHLHLFTAALLGMPAPKEDYSLFPSP